jgi:hypothetical protein
MHEMHPMHCPATAMGASSGYAGPGSSKPLLLQAPSRTQRPRAPSPQQPATSAVIAASSVVSASSEGTRNSQLPLAPSSQQPRAPASSHTTSHQRRAQAPPPCPSRTTARQIDAHVFRRNIH